jgi:hypothetical protein
MSEARDLADSERAESAFGFGEDVGHFLPQNQLRERAQMPYFYLAFYLYGMNADELLSLLTPSRSLTATLTTLFPEVCRVTRPSPWCRSSQRR